MVGGDAGEGQAEDAPSTHLVKALQEPGNDASRVESLVKLGYPLPLADLEAKPFEGSPAPLHVEVFAPVQALSTTVDLFKMWKAQRCRAKRLQSSRAALSPLDYGLPAGSPCSWTARAALEQEQAEEAALQERAGAAVRAVIQASFAGYEATLCRPS